MTRVLVLFLILMQFQTSVAMFCADSYGFAQAAANKWGGRVSNWESFIAEITGVSPTQRRRLDDIIRNSQRQGFFQRKINTYISFRMMTMMNSLREAVRMEAAKAVVGSTKDFDHVQRKALLLRVYRTWWWEAKSDYPSRWAPWFKPSFYLGKLIYQKFKGPFDRGMEDILNSYSRPYFFKSLFHRYAREKDMIQEIIDRGGPSTEFLEIMDSRMKWLRERRYEIANEGPSYSKDWMMRMLDYEIARLEVLAHFTRIEHNPTNAEIAEVSRIYGVSLSSKMQNHILALGMKTTNGVVDVISLLLMGVIIESIFIEDDSFLFDDDPQEAVPQSPPVDLEKLPEENFFDRDISIAIDQFQKGEITEAELQEIFRRRKEATTGHSQEIGSDVEVLREMTGKKRSIIGDGLPSEIAIPVYHY